MTSYDNPYQFGSAIRGELILPDHEEYEDARNVWNSLINEYPAIVVRVADSDDVAAAISFARNNGLAPPTGSAGDVGIAGTTLGGGVGWIRRKHGLAIDALRRVEIVTPDGTVREASRERNADLFWALRGGGGNFGVVTEFEFDCYEVGPVVPALGVFYPQDDARAGLETYREVMADAPEELSTDLVDGHVPPLPPIPDELHGEDSVAILGCCAGAPDEGMAAVDPLRNVTDPLLDLSEPMPYELRHDLGTQLFPWGRKYAWRSVFVDRLTDEIHDAVLERMEAAPGPMDAIDIWSMGGNIGHGDAAFNTP